VPLLANFQLVLRLLALLLPAAAIVIGLLWRRRVRTRNDHHFARPRPPAGRL
jgi:hypothetical protein